MPRPTRSKYQESGFSHIILLFASLVILLIIGVVIAANIKTTKEFSQDNTNVKGLLLAKGGDDDDSGSGGSNNSGSGSSDSNSGSGSSGSSNSGSSGNSESGGANIPQATPKTVKTEIRFSETEKIKTEVRDDRTRVDVYSGGIKVRYEVRDGRVIVKAENEAGEDVPEQDLLKIVERVDKSDIKVATAGGEILVSRNNIGALSSFPIQVDLNTNELIITTPAGTKTLTILPDQAVQNLLAANVISRLDSTVIKQEAVTSVSSVVSLGERNGVPVYEINGFKDQKLLGFIPVVVPTTVIVSTETGQPVAQEQSLLADIIDILSP